MHVAAFKNSLKPFCLEYQPLLEEIMRKETVLRELVEGATMAQILGTVLVVCSGEQDILIEFIENSGDLQAMKATIDVWGNSLKYTLKR